MSNVAQDLLNKKKSRSPYAQLKDDGDTIEGLITGIKSITKQGFGGEEVEVLRIILQCNLPEIGLINKAFDNGSMKWLDEVTEKGLEKGDTIRIVRHGEYNSNKTYYEAIILMKQGQAVEMKEEAQTDAQADTPPPADEPPMPDQE